ncbi:MAG: MBL fold metallo-hydrolase [Solobacterium sp.]|nr:MBL fold metallo-hydrolase [Solobacterium sp.]
MGRTIIGKVRDGVWQLNEENYVDSWLVTGRKEAVLIDSLQYNTDLYDRIRSITDLPLKVLLTHGHGDHAGRSLEVFAQHDVPVYMDPADGFLTGGLSFHPLHEGDLFDLGGVVLETISCRGHTPGSAVFLDREREYLFSGDSVGSGGFWLQLPHSLPLASFREELIKLMKITENMKDLRIYPGHRYQSPVQLDRQYLNDELDLINDLISGKETSETDVMTAVGQEIVFARAHRGLLLDFLYDPEKLV